MRALIAIAGALALGACATGEAPAKSERCEWYRTAQVLLAMSIELRGEPTEDQRSRQILYAEMIEVFCPPERPEGNSGQ